MREGVLINKVLKKVSLIHFRSDTHLAIDLEMMHASTSTTATAMSVQEDSGEELYDLNNFRKPTSLREKSSRNDNTQSENASHTSDHFVETTNESEGSEVTNIADRVTDTSASPEDNLKIGYKTPLSPVKQQDTTESTKTSYLYYSMELCKGDTLEHSLSPYVLTKEQTCEILHQITVGIAYIHEKNLVSAQISCRKGLKISDIFA
jgi:serine/threonine protein kinase